MINHRNNKLPTTSNKLKDLTTNLSTSSFAQTAVQQPSFEPLNVTGTSPVGGVAPQQAATVSTRLPPIVLHPQLSTQATGAAATTAGGALLASSQQPHSSLVAMPSRFKPTSTNGTSSILLRYGTLGGEQNHFESQRRMAPLVEERKHSGGLATATSSGLLTRLGGPNYLTQGGGGATSGVSPRRGAADLQLLNHQNHNNVRQHLTLGSHRNSNGNQQHVAAASSLVMSQSMSFTGGVVNNHGATPIEPTIRQRGSYRHTVNAHTLQHVLGSASGASINNDARLQQKNKKTAISTSQTMQFEQAIRDTINTNQASQSLNKAANNHRQTLQEQAQAARLEQLILNSAGRRGPSSNMPPPTTTQRQNTNNLPSNMQQHSSNLPQQQQQKQQLQQQQLQKNKILSELQLAILPQKASAIGPSQPQTSQAQVTTTTMIDTTSHQHQRGNILPPVDLSLANSFKFNPIARERNAGLQQQSQQIASNGNSDSVNATSAPQSSRPNKNINQYSFLQEQISKNLMVNFPLNTTQQPSQQNTEEELPLPPQQKLEDSNSHLNADYQEDGVDTAAARDVEQQTKNTTNSHVDVMALHMQNMASQQQNQLPSEQKKRKRKIQTNCALPQESTIKVEEEKQEESKFEENEQQIEFVGREVSPQKQSKPNNSDEHQTQSIKDKQIEQPIASKTCEIGCGPDLVASTDRQDKDQEDVQLEQRNNINNHQLLQQNSCSSDTNESEMAETLVQQTFVEKKADRLIKEYESDGALIENQAAANAEELSQTEEVKSAVKQIQLEVELSDEENMLRQEQQKRECATQMMEEVEIEEVARRNQPVEVLTSQATHTPPQISQEFNSSSQSNTALTAAPVQKSSSEEAEEEEEVSEPPSPEIKRQPSFNAKKSLLTSTGCGPDGSQMMMPQNNNHSKVVAPGAKKIKLKKKPDQRAHIMKFSASLVFNAIERVTKAGSELIQRNQDQENPVQQINQNKILYDFDSEAGLEACRKYLECLENLFALSFLKRASRDYRQHFTAAYRVLYDNPVASPLNYLVEILDSAQESFPYLWVNGKKYEFSQMVLQQGNMMYQTFSELKDAISQLHLSVVTAKATMSQDFCQLTPEDLLRHRTKVERLLEQFDQDWSIYERAYVTELMSIEADARRHVTEAIRIVQQMRGYESEQKLRGRILNTSTDEEYNSLRNKFLRQICEINQVANSIGQGRDDLDVSVLIVADEVSRKISANQSVAVRQLCTHIQRSFNNMKNLFLERYAENVEVVDPQLRNNPELVHLVARFEKAWCLGRTHLVPKDEREQLISFSQLIEGTSEKYPQFREQVECSDAEIFLTIPNLLVLKSSLDTGKEAQIATSVCQRFFPVMFQRPEGTQAENPTSIYFKFQQLKADLGARRSKASDFFDFYNKIEQQILFGITQTPKASQPSEKSSDLAVDKKKMQTSSNWKLLESQAGVIKEIGMSMTRQQPTEWNEFMIVALGIPEDEPLPFLQQDSQAVAGGVSSSGGDIASPATDSLVTGIAESAIATDLEVLVVPQTADPAIGQQLQPLESQDAATSAELRMD